MRNHEHTLNNQELLLIPEEDRYWVVTHTRPRCEKRLQDFCGINNIPAYLPLKQKKHRYGARNRVFSKPLFPGYLFCIVSDQSRMTLKQNQYVANVLVVYDQEKMLAQLRHIQRALDMGEVVEVLPYLATGKFVTVTQGPFKGMEGVVKTIKGITRVIINVDMVQQSVAVEVDSAILIPA